MRALFCVMDSPGLAMQMIGLAQELRQMGHATACVAHAAAGALCDEHGLERIRDDCERSSFALRRWAAPPATLLQLRHLARGIEAFGPDVIVASPFGYGPAIAAKEAAIPLAVAGGLVHLWRPGSARREEGMRWYEAGRAAAGLPPLAAGSRVPWLGDLFLLPSTPGLSGAREGEDGACHVGDCASGAPATPPDSELEAWLARVPPATPIVYAQCGREFGAAPIRDHLATAADALGLAIAVDTGRNDLPCSYRSERVLARPFIPHQAVLPHASFVIASGQPTSVLGALRHALPLVLLPHGSGTEETAEACVASGVARAHPFAELTPEALARMLAEVLGAPEMQRAAASLRAELAGLGGRTRAAEAIAALGGRAIWTARSADAAAPP